MQELQCSSRFISVVLQAQTVYETQLLCFPFHNEEGSEMAFQESVRENPLILSPGNSWAVIVIREHSPDFPAIRDYSPSQQYPPLNEHL